MSHSDKKDKIYNHKQDMIVDFVFDEKVAHVFPDMIRRSVPGYDSVIPLLGVIAEKFVTPDSHIYDLGCSLGAATLSMRRRIQHEGCQIIAVDNAEAMVSQCKNNIENDDQGSTPVNVICDDIQNIDIRNASLVVMNFTLQFIEPDKRLSLLTNIASGINKGGAFILSEKVIDENTSHQQLLDDLHLAFKRANGYSDLEISQKRTALENVLIPDSVSEHEQRLREAGFRDIVAWQRCLNFVSLLAIK